MPKFVIRAAVDGTMVCEVEAATPEEALEASVLADWKVDQDNPPSPAESFQVAELGANEHEVETWEVCGERVMRDTVASEED